MKKKIVLVLAVVAAALLLIAGYFKFLAPKAQVGAKAVTVQIVMKDKGISKTFQYQTNSSYLADLLKEKKDELKPVLQSGQYGEFVSGLLGMTADPKKEFFNIKVNGTDATLGVSQLPLENGKTYTFTLTKL